MEDKDIRPATEADVKGKIDEVAPGWRKRRKEDDICLEKRAYSPTASRTTRNLEGFYFEDWNEALQEEDECQTPNKWQRIAQTVFRGGCLLSRDNPVECGYISSSCTQHQGGRCICGVERRNLGAEKAELSTQPLRLYGRRRLTRYQDYRIFAFKHLTVRTYLNLVLDLNKQLICTCCIKLFRAEGYNNVPRHIRLLFDYCRRES